MTADLDHRVVVGDAFNHAPLHAFSLVICDPPYGITEEAWDTPNYDKWFRHCSWYAAKDATICIWGGVGKFQNRPLLDFAASFENTWTTWRIANWITWAKRRAYGKKNDYLFTREECLILVRGEPTFNIPYLPRKRGYAGYYPKYPAKSEFLRRTNVWTDVTEIFQGKVHPTQKPNKLYRILVETHSNPGDWVYDPCAGSLTTRRACIQTGRSSYCVEINSEYVEKGLAYQSKDVAA